MKKWIRLICVGLILAAIPGVLRAAELLPLRTQPLIEKKYAGWSGVLRVWVFEGWTGGSDLFSGWLNRCAAAYEKAHNGVYVQIQYVDSEAIVQMDSSGVRPPDMILFPPGLLRDARPLAPVSSDAVRATLRNCGGGYAVPVALGGYALVCLRDADNPDPIVPAAPGDEPYRRWSAALEALLAEEPSEEETAPEAAPGIDLGLPASANGDAMTRFIRGEIPAVAATQKEIARLQRLSDQGKGPDWTVVRGADYTDQLLLASIPSSDAERESLCAEFLSLLLSEEHQAELSRCGAFSVLETLTGYSANSPYLEIDLALHRDSLRVPPAFSGQSTPNETDL